MGPSMSNPDRFKHLNKQRHLLAYQRKHHTQISLDSKIKFKTISQFPSANHRGKSQHKIIMVKQQNTLGIQTILPNAKKKMRQNEQELKQCLETPKKKDQIQQNYGQINKISQEYQYQNNHINSLKPDPQFFVNSQSKKLSIRKIVLNNQAYEIDIEKMKNRRLKSKERYSRIILSNGSTMSKLNPFNTKQSFTTNSIPKGVSTLELESQLNPILQQTTNMEGTQEYLQLRNVSRQRLIQSRNRQSCELQKIRAEYYDEYLGSFESKQSQEYQQKVRKSVSDKKIQKANKFLKTEKQRNKMQETYSFSQYEIRSEKKLPSKKSQKTASSIKTLPQPQTALLDLQQNSKKPRKLIKVQKNKDQSLRPSLNL